MPDITITDKEIKKEVSDAKDRSLTHEAKNKLLGIGDGLYLSITKRGTASWLYRYMSGKTAKAVGLGGYPDTSLATARDKAKELKKARAAGIDPSDLKKEQSAAKKREADKAKTFETCANEYIAYAEGEWRNKKHRQQWLNTLTQYAFPVIGKKQVAKVNKDDLIEILNPIWKEKHETATRLRGRIELILGWASANDLRQGANPAKYKDLLEYKLPKVKKKTVKAHHPSLHYSELSKFMSHLYQQEGMSRYALEFLILCGSRTSEVTNAEWSEFDMEQGIWTIPGERMKAGLEHRIPMSPKALELLRNIRGFSGKKYVFITTNKDKPMSNMAMSMLLRRMEYEDITVHGMRSTFRKWAAERTEHPYHVCEQALAHGLKSEVEEAYVRSDFFDKRANLMRDWASFALKEFK